LGKRKKRILATLIRGKKINLINNKKEGKFNKNKFIKFEKGKNFKRGNESGKECWECDKEGHFQSDGWFRSNSWIVGWFGKQGIVELCGMSSTEIEGTPKNICYINE